MAGEVYNSLQKLLDQIFKGECDMTLEDFEKKVEEAYSYGAISGYEHDELMGYG